MNRNRQTGGVSNERPERYQQQEWSEDAQRADSRYRADRSSIDSQGGWQDERGSAPYGRPYASRGAEYPRDAGYHEYGRDYAESTSQSREPYRPYSGPFNEPRPGYYEADATSHYGGGRGSSHRYDADLRDPYRAERQARPEAPRGHEYGRQEYGAQQRWSQEPHRASREFAREDRHAGMDTGAYRADSEYGRASGRDFTGSADPRGFQPRAGEQRQTGFAGRGPKGYQRSDERLKEDVCERLTDDPAIDASDISLEVSGGKVVLQGQVEQRWMKHHVENLVDRCSGVKDIDNRLQVSPRQEASNGSTSSLRGSSVGGSNTGAAKGSASTPGPVSNRKN